MPVSSETYKRTTSLLNPRPETIVDIQDKWKRLHHVSGASSSLDTHERIYMPASNVNRTPEEGCMKKIKIERSMKLRKEDIRNRDFNVVSNNQEPESVWIDSFQGQKEELYEKVHSKIKDIHEEKSQIATTMTQEDFHNQKIRVNMDYMPKKNITFSSSIRYKFTPQDNGIF